MLLWERFLLLLLAVVTAAVVVAGTVTLWQIVVLSIVSSAVLAIGLPATQTLVLNYVPKDSLQAGHSINTLTNSMGRALGPLSGGFLIAGFGLGSPFMALIGLYVLSLFFTFRLPKIEPDKKPHSSAVREIADGLRMIGRVMSVFSLSLQMMMFGWFLGAWIGTLIGNTQMILIGTAIYAVINFGVIFTSPQLRRL